MSKSAGRLSASVLLATLLLSACGTSGDGAANPGGDGQGTATGTQQQTAGVSTVSANDLPGLQRELTQNVGDRVLFVTDRWDLSSDDQSILRRQAAWLSQHPQLLVTIAGHGDERGTREYNLALGERRATTVEQFLQALGVDPHRLSVISYGKEQPDCVDADEACWSRNRRAVTLLAQQ
ncbi:MAG TPA: peptidoglycan-associated lipoprotein Pal [Terriglobales bacterium]|nr:peptidoglycan-associated lipoprotein Pal [Terriglobales bacterium]